MGNRLAQYLFVYDDQVGVFPERWRILREGEAGDPADSAELTGTVREADLPKMRRRFATEYDAPHYDISTARANSWAAVCSNYRGLRDHAGQSIDAGPRAEVSAAEKSDSIPEHTPTRQPPAKPKRPERPRRLGRWTKLLLGLYLLAAASGAAILVHALNGLPADFPTMTITDDNEVRTEAERLREWVAVEVPAAADWLAPMGLFNFEDALRGLLTPSDWQLANVPLEERAERLDRSIESIRKDYLNAASLLGVIFGGGFLFACLALARPNLGTAVLVCILPLFSTPIATEPLIGVDNMSLFYMTLPMLITGGGFLLIEAARAIGSSVVGPRSEAWTRVWIGLAMIVAGAAATAVSIGVSAATNAGVMAVAFGPVVYGVFSILWGIAGLFRRRRKK